MYTVNDIGIEEEVLFKRMPLGGHIEQRDCFLSKNSLYEAWGEIYVKYVKLTQCNDLEALKRALFFAWYQLAEPSWLSGIRELPDQETRTVIEALERFLEQGVEDQELSYMLPYYMSICDYYLERFYPLPNIQKISTEKSCDVGVKAIKSNWLHRGQMGKYWLSVAINSHLGDSTTTHFQHP